MADDERILEIEPLVQPTTPADIATASPTNTQQLEEYGNQIAGLENALAAARDARSASATSDVLSQLLTLQSKVPFGSSAQNRIQALVQESSDQLKELSGDGASAGLPLSISMAPIPPLTALEQAVYGKMTEDEKRYFDSLVPGKTYSLISVDEHGRVIEGTLREGKDGVDGQTLREHFTRIKYHALSDEDKKEVDAAVETAQKKGGRLGVTISKDEKKELENLDKSLKTLEEKEAAELHAEGNDVQVARNHTKFNEARRQIRHVTELHDKVSEVENSKTSTEAQKGAVRFALKLAKDDLRTTLKEDIMEDTLTHSEHAAQGKANEQGVEVSKEQMLVAQQFSGQKLPASVTRAR